MNLAASSKSTLLIDSNDSGSAEEKTSDIFGKQLR